MHHLRLLPLLLLGACSSMPDVTSVVSPYRIDIRQGNFVSQEMVAQLKPGMTKDQVRFVLGTPLVADIFHADRWDYVYLFRPSKGERQQRKLTVFFEDGKLSRVAGDVVAADAADAAGAAAPTPKTRMIDIGGDAAKPDGAAKKDEAAAAGKGAEQK